MNLARKKDKRRRFDPELLKFYPSKNFSNVVASISVIVTYVEYLIHLYTKSVLQS